MNVESPIELKVRISFQDYWRATLAYMIRHLKVKWLIATAIIYLGIFLYSQVFSPIVTPTYLLLIPLAAVGFIYAILYFNTRLLFAGKKFLHHEVRYVFSNEGLEAIAPESPGMTGWSSIPKAYELENDFLIYYTTERMYTIPKRYLEDEVELKRFRAMLASHLGSRVKLLG
jgi:hypothetical protein